MTVSPDVRPVAPADLGQAIDVLRERGLRLSTSRRLVLESLFAADAPVSAEQIAVELGLDLASVYRNLETFERNGIVRHVHFGHGPGLFCDRCGAVAALDPALLEPVRDQIRELSGYEARFAHFAIVGRCPACARRPT
jgi:Fur family ferric uptake transcriptional regulator